MRVDRVRLNTRRPFAIAGHTTTHVDVVRVAIEREGRTGLGEAAPSQRVTGEDAGAAAAALRHLSGQAIEAHAEAVAHALESPAGIPPTIPGLGPAARCALETALLDLLGQERGVPLHALLGLPAGTRTSSITISLADEQGALEEAAQRVEEGWSALKVKLGGPRDEAVLRALRDAHPDMVLRVDANEAWTPATALERARLLERLDADLVEQPLPRHMLQESAALAAATELPVVLDEAVQDEAGLHRLIQAGSGDGANLKLQKLGGPLAARRLLHVLKEAHWGAMVGCNLESGIAVAAGAAFAGAVEWVDLDAHALLVDDTDLDTPGGRVTSPSDSGLGCRPFKPSHQGG